jgi:acyl dehydratase
MAQRDFMAGVITDGMVADVRSRINREFKTREEPHLTEATKDAIRHWARAIGDLDPKWTDESYASKTRFGGITAPPSLLYGFSTLSIGDRTGFPGIHSFFAGADHRWYLPIRRNDTITLSCVLTDLVEKKSNFSRRMFKQVSEVTYRNQRGEIVARSWPWGMRTERGTAASVGKYNNLKLASYTADDIQRIGATYATEPDLVRGSTPRYWEDVRIGDAIGPILRGPWTATNSITFLTAHGGLYMKTHSYWYSFLKRHPQVGIPNEQGIPEPPARGHWDNEFARKIGVPAAYDYGPERVAWACTLFTYWCGDDGWLKGLHVEVRRFNLMGDLTTVEGTVTDKRVDEDGDHIVKCEFHAHDQRGEEHTTGHATIVLPCRVKGP